MDHQQVPVGPALRRLTRGGAVTVLLVATLVFFGGWALNLGPLRNVVPGTVDMKPLTAIGLFLSAASLWLLMDAQGDRRRQLAGYVCAVGPIVIGAAVLGEYVFGWRLGIDELFFGNIIRHGVAAQYPGRPAPTTGFSLITLGLALLTLDVRPRRGWGPAELLALSIAVIAATSVVGYIYEIPQFYGPASATKMALNTSICFLLLSGGVVVARPRGRLLRLATTDDPGGIMLRRLLPLGIALPILLGKARLAAVDDRLFSDRAGTWWLSAVTALAFALLITRVASRLSRYASERGLLEAELQHLASHDPLTGLLNRRRFNDEMLAAEANWQRHDHVYCLIHLDLDRMKRVNDEFGHRAGDDLLQAVAHLVTERLRGTDRAARLGGDEFAVLLPNTDLDGAAVLGEELRRSIADRFPHQAQNPWTTVSVGIARALGAGDGLDDVMARADQAMYQAKRAGGDRVTTQLRPAPRAPTAGLAAAA